MTNKWTQNRKRKILVRGAGWCLCVGVWTVALLTTQPMEVGKAVMPSPFHYPASKTLHVLVYAFLTLYISWLPIRGWRWLLLAFLSLHAAGTEFGQQFVPGRTGKPFDVLLDHLGLLLGLALAWKRWLPRRARRWLRGIRWQNRGQEPGVREEAAASLLTPDT
jgi:VanZ family protein